MLRLHSKHDTELCDDSSEDEGPSPKKETPDVAIEVFDRTRVREQQHPERLDRGVLG